MIRIYLFICFFCFYSICVSQNLYDAQWVLGYDFSPDLEDCYHTRFDFRNDTLKIDTIHCQGNLSIRGANTSMSDKNGNLLFYSNGCEILNRRGEIMPGGDEITPGFIEDIFCGNTGHPLTLGVLSLPEPCSDSLYHLFNIDWHQGVFDEQPVGTTFAALTLYHNIIDMSKSNGLGEVVLEKSIAIQDTLSNGNLSATLHANGLDWWVTVPEAHSNCIYTFLLTQGGISEPVKKCKGHIWNNVSLAATKFSPDGKYYARYNLNNGLNIMSFDNEVGEFAEPINIQLLNNDFYDHLGLSFSPNSRFIYVSAGDKLYQFDLMSENIDSSKVIVAEYDGYVNISRTFFNRSSLARDGKIYIGSFFTHRNLHVIHRPNEKGIACDVEQHAIEIPTISYNTGPNIPYYPPEFNTSSCTAVSSQQTLANSYDLSLFPNPTTGVLQVSGTLDERFTLKMYSLSGILVKSLEVGLNEDVDIFSLPTGLYFYTISIDDETIISNGKLNKI